MIREAILNLIRSTQFSVRNNFHPAPKKILINSIPKAGTHLMSSMLGQIPDLSIALDLTGLDKLLDDEERLRFFKAKTSPQPNGLWLGHIPFTETIDTILESSNVPTIFIYRDPRDIVVSLLHYIRKSKNHIYRNILLECDPLSAMKILIEGYGNGKERYDLSSTSIPSLSNYINAYSPWLSSKHCLSVSYEGFIGQDQEENLTRICDYLDLDHSIKAILQKGIGHKNSSTLRQGKIKSWQTEISAHELDLLYAQKWSDSSLKTFYNE